MYGLSKKQRDVYNALLDMWAVYNRQPNLSELASSLGMHYVTLKQHLDALETKGHISIDSQGPGRTPIIHIGALLKAA